MLNIPKFALCLAVILSLFGPASAGTLDGSGLRFLILGAPQKYIEVANKMLRYGFDYDTKPLSKLVDYNVIIIFVEGWSDKRITSQIPGLTDIQFAPSDNDSIAIYNVGNGNSKYISIILHNLQKITEKTLQCDFLSAYMSATFNDYIAKDVIGNNCL